MGFDETWKKKLDKKGNPILENGDFVMELVSSVEVEDVVSNDNIVVVDLNSKESINSLIEKLSEKKESV